MALPPIPREEIAYDAQGITRNIHSLFLYLRRVQDLLNNAVTTIIQNDPTIIINSIDLLFTDSSTIDVVFDSGTSSFSFNIIDGSITSVKLGTNSVITSKILNSNVTFPKIQDITAGKLLGRNASSSGVVEEITLGTNLSLTGTTLNASGSGSGLTLVPVMTGFMPTPGGLPILYADTLGGTNLVSEFIYNDLGSIIMAEITV